MFRPVQFVCMNSYVFELLRISIRRIHSQYRFVDYIERRGGTDVAFCDDTSHVEWNGLEMDG